MRLVLLGPPGSGKGTQAVGLAAELNVPHIATGDLFRHEIATGTGLGRLANSFMAYGNLVPDEVVNDLMRIRLAEPSAEGFVLDGYPRTVEQAEALEQILHDVQRPLDKAIELAVPDEVLIGRAVGRQVCPLCGTIYHLESKPPKIPGVCDIDRGQLQVRDDDKPTTVRHRLAVYHRLTEPVLAFYRERNLLEAIEGVGNRDQIGQALRSVLRL
jgi:adenylate kinase